MKGYTVLPQAPQLLASVVKLRQFPEQQVGAVVGHCFVKCELG